MKMTTIISAFALAASFAVHAPKTDLSPIRDRKTPQMSLKKLALPVVRM